MRTPLLYLCCILLPGLLYGQGRNLEFIKRFNEAPTDTAKAGVYREAMRYYSRRNADSVKYYADIGLAYFRARKSRLAEAFIVDQLAIIDQNQGRINTSRQRTEYVLNIYRDLNYKPGIASAIGNLGALEAGMGEYDKALKHLVEALQLVDTVGNDDVRMTSYMNIATIYMNTGDTANAGRYLRMAYDITEGKPLTDKAIGLFNMMGVLYAIEGKNDMAIECFMHNLELSDHPDFLNAHVECLSYIGQYYLENAQPDKALSYLKVGLEIATKNDIAELRSNILQEMAAITREKDPNTALKYLNEALDIATEMNNRNFMVTIYEHLAAVYKQTGKYREALDATERKQKITDSIFSISKAGEINGMMATYELEKSNSMLRELEVKHVKQTAQRNLLLGIAIGVALLAIVLFVFYRRLMALNARLKAHEAALQQLNDMKDKLFSIIAHDMRGPVARIPVILDIYEDPETGADEKQFLLDNLRAHTKELIEMLEKLLLWGQSLVKGIILRKETVNVAECIDQDISLKKLALEEKNITVSNNTPRDLGVLADLTHFDFIIRNLITNAVKYSHEGGSIVIEANTAVKPGFVVISVKDSGTGIPADLLGRIFTPVRSTPGTANEKGTGIGLMLCHEFAALNGGDMWVKSEPGKGATFYVALKQA